ncbi:putative F-box protein [Arachis hypogaea]|nr:putative F-box protein [Arachis hypogaea]
MLQWSMVPLMAGSLDAAINTFEHEGQVESDLENRENGELLEMKVAMKLGRSVSQLRELASKSASYRIEGITVDEFASKL